MAAVRRNTRQRGVILEELRKVVSHPTATGLYEIVRRKLPRISLGTVYRNLDLLVDAGLVQKLEACGAEARYDADVRQHDHMRCVGCGQVDDIHGPPLDLVGGDGNDFRGYEVVGRHLELLGVCPACQGRRSNPKRDEGSKDLPGSLGNPKREHPNSP